MGAAAEDRLKKVLVNTGRQIQKIVWLVAKSFYILKTARHLPVMYCGKEETGYVNCPNGHYICDSCHGGNLFEAIKMLLLSADGISPQVLLLSYFIQKLTVKDVLVLTDR